MKELTVEGNEARASLLHGLLTRLGILLRRRNGDGHSLRETLEELIEEDEEEPREREFTDEERALLLNALSFGELQVWDVMVPRTDIKAIEAGATLAEVVGTMRDAMHTRLPVYRGALDEVVGMVHIKDMLPYWSDGADFKLERIVRKVLFVPGSMRVLDLLLQMRDTAIHMAIVVDEYGGTDGLATIEDLVEEIVGEIQDEHDNILPPQIAELPDGALEADARVEVEELERRLGLSLLEPDRREDV
ncbi:MAG: CBS domain-containing protein, partial [Geminicoccaceae bacterium]